MGNAEYNRDHHMLIKQLQNTQMLIRKCASVVPPGLSSFNNQTEAWRELESSYKYKC